MDIFPIAPAASRAIWFVLLIPGLVLVLVTALLVVTVNASRTARFEVSPQGLRLHGDFYGRLIPSAALRGGAARRVDFGRNPELSPHRRTLGTGMPGYRAGWFRLRNGEKSLLYLTDTTRAVYVPTTAGYSVLLSPADPDAFVAALAAVNWQP